MKSVFVLALAGSAVAAPSFGNVVDALFGRDKHHHHPHPSDFPGLPSVGSGSGLPFPYPTATGAPFPTGTSGVEPSSGSDSHKKHKTKALHIDYQLAPTTAPAIKKRELKYRQLGGSAIPSFSLFDPSAIPTATEPATGLPTETGSPELPSGIPTDLPGMPTGYPTPPAGGPTAPFPFPTGGAPFPTDAPFPTAPAGTGAPGFPGLPTTFGTVTRGPRPTAAPYAPGEEDGEKKKHEKWWLQWVGGLMHGGKGTQN